MHFKDLYKYFLDKLVGYESRVIHPTIEVELLVEVSFDTFVQVCYSDENGRYRIKEFTGVRWTKKIMLPEIREIEFKVFVNNSFLKKDQWVLLRKTVNSDEVTQVKFYLDNSSLYEGWFRLT